MPNNRDSIPYYLSESRTRRATAPGAAKRLSLADELLAKIHTLPPLGRGELAVLALGRATPGSLILLDEALARREARRLKLHAQGTLGVLVEAYRRRHLTQPQLALLLDEIALRPDIWIRASLCRQVLENLPDLPPAET